MEYMPNMPVTMESFIGTCCVSSFFESSRSDPDIAQAGNCYNPARHGKQYQLDAVDNTGLSSNITYIPMFSRKEKRFTRASWDYSWSAGKGQHQMTQAEIEKNKSLFGRPVPAHFCEALQRQRQQVMQMGFADSWQDPVELEMEASKTFLSGLSQSKD